MEFNVAQLLMEPGGASRRYRVDEPCSPAEERTGALSGDLTLLRTDRSILVTGDLATTIEVACSRCLAAVRVPLTLQLQEEYYPSVDALTGALLPAPEDPTDFVIDEHHVLDLSEAVRQQVLVAVPMQPLCRPDCAGLCPDCGADRNLGLCACSSEEFDSRWTSLSGLLKKRE